nr:MAG TPA: hypothetical protein [Caudoviricetes sp.]
MKTKGEIERKIKNFKDKILVITEVLKTEVISVKESKRLNADIEDFENKILTLKWVLEEEK